MSRETKCKKHTKCNSEYSKCDPTPQKKTTNYYKAKDIWGCRSDIINKYFPPKKSSKYNPKHIKCSYKCHKNRKGKSKNSLDKMKLCETECNKKFPTKLIYNYGKLIDKVWAGQKKVSKKLKKSRLNKKKHKKRILYGGIVGPNKIVAHNKIVALYKCNFCSFTAVKSETVWTHEKSCKGRNTVG